MKLVLCCVVSLLIVSVCGKNYFFGDKSADDELVHRARVEHYAIPWTKRVEYFNYNNTSEQPIKVINCYDYQRTDASVNVIAGGVGYNHVTLRLKSERSYGLDYAIEIYV